MTEVIQDHVMWSGRVELTEHVKIGRHGTLSIAPGTEIVGNGFAIASKGQLFAVGEESNPILFDDVRVTDLRQFVDLYGTGTSEFVFDFVEFVGKLPESRMAERFALQNSIVHDITESTKTFSGSFSNNVIVDLNGLSFSFDVRDGVTPSFEGNIVDRLDGRLVTNANPGVGTFRSENNAYLANHVWELHSDYSLKNDYFQGDFRLDEDFAYEGSVELAEEPPLGLARTLYVYETLRLPSDIIADATLVGSRNASLLGNGLDNVLTGNVGANGLSGERGADTLLGGNRADTLDGGAGSDSLAGGMHSDSLVGGSGRDILLGENGKDVLSGGGTVDRLDGGAGRDTLDGGSGADVLTGGAGDDVLAGGEGADTFVFAPRFGTDKIEGFGPGSDHVELRGVAPASVALAVQGEDTALLIDGEVRIVFIGAAGDVTDMDIVFA